MRIVEHDDNKGYKTTFQFTTSLEKSAQEADTEVGCLLLMAPSANFSTPFRLCWKNIRTPRARTLPSSVSYQMCSSLLGTRTAFLLVSSLLVSAGFVPTAGADSLLRLPAVGSYVSGCDHGR